MSNPKGTKAGSSGGHATTPGGGGETAPGSLLSRSLIRGVHMTGLVANRRTIQWGPIAAIPTAHRTPWELLVRTTVTCPQRPLVNHMSMVESRGEDKSHPSSRKPKTKSGLASLVPSGATLNTRRKPTMGLDTDIPVDWISVGIVPDGIHVDNYTGNEIAMHAGLASRAEEASAQRRGATGSKRSQTTSFGCGRPSLSCRPGSIPKVQSITSH